MYLALTGAPAQLSGTGVRYYTIKNMLDNLPYKAEVMALGVRYGKEYHNEQSGIDIKDTEAYYGIGLYDLIREYGNDEALRRFQCDGRKAFLPVFTMKTLLEHYKPDICVVTSSPRMEKAAAIASNQLGIPVVRINDLPVCNPIQYDCTLCVMNSWAKEYAAKCAGYPEESIVVTGQPVLEDEDNFITDERTQELIEKTKNFTHIVVFFTENGVDQGKEIDSIYSIAREMPSILFIIKIHPNQESDNILKSDLDNVWIKKDAAKYYLQIEDLAITTFSTTGLQTAMLGKPLIVVNYTNSVYLPDYEQMGIAVVAHDTDELKSHILEQLNKDSFEYIELKNKQKKFEMTKNAASNICKIIENKMK